MRTWLAIVAATLALAGSLDAAEARGRGFGRMSSGRAPTSYNPVATASAARMPPEASRTGSLGLRPGIAVTPGRLTAAAATAPAIAAPALRLSEEPVAAPSRSAPGAATDPSRQVQEARAALPACAPERRIGSLSGAEGGFCLIN